MHSKLPPFYGPVHDRPPGPDEEEGATRLISRQALLPEAVGVTYRLGRRLGQGGFAEIYEAEEVFGEGPGQGQATRRVALKRLLPSMRLDPMRRRHLQREAHLAAQLNHPNIVRVLGLVSLPGPGDLGDEPALVMELVEGIAAHQLLHRLAARSRRLTLPAVVHIIEGLLRALSYLSDPPFLSKGPRPLVHADISLENLMVTTGGEIKLVDFGIAGLDASVPIDDDEGVTSIHQVAGKRPYTPLAGGGGPRASAASDLYAAGVCLWELLTGLRFPVLPRGASSREMGSLIALSADGLPEAAWAALKLCLTPQAAPRQAVGQALRLLRTLPTADRQEEALGRLVRSLLAQAQGQAQGGGGEGDADLASEPQDPVVGLLTRLRSAFCASRVLAYQPVPPEEIDDMGGHEFILREGLGGGASPQGQGQDQGQGQEEIMDAPLRDALDRGFLEEDGALFFRVQVPGAGPHVVVIQPGPGCVYDALAKEVLRALLS